MKKMGLGALALLLAISFSGVISSCSESADEYIAAAETAINDAIEIGADIDSPRLLDKARVAFQEAKSLNEKGQVKQAIKKAETAELQANKAAKNAMRLDDARSNKAGDRY